MKHDILFEETQRVPLIFRTIFLISTLLMGTFAIKESIHAYQASGSLSAGIFALIFGAFLMGLITFFIFIIKLETQVQREGISVRFFPFHQSFKNYLWQGIQNVYVRRYSPIREYGGWGLRFGLNNKGDAYNLRGREGLQIEFTNGKKLLIGTQQGMQLTMTLQNLGQYRPEEKYA